MAAHAWTPNEGDNSFEVFVNSRIDSAFFMVNSELMAVVNYPFTVLGYVVFNSHHQAYFLDDVCHAVQVPEESCACGLSGWNSLYCNTLESYFMGPFLANPTPEWSALNGANHAGLIRANRGIKYRETK